MSSRSPYGSPPPLSPYRSPIGSPTPRSPTGFRALPSELRSHIGGFVPTGLAGVGTRALNVEAQDLINELRSFGLDPAEIIAKERLRLRELKRLQNTPAYRLYQLLYDRGYRYLLEPVGDRLDIMTVDQDLPDALHQAGYQVRVRPAGMLGREIVSVAIPNQNIDYEALYRDIVQIYESIHGKRSQVDEDTFDFR